MNREISLPFRVDRNGRIATTVDPNVIVAQHLRTYLMTSPGERVMRPLFGTVLSKYAFENLDSVELNLLTTRVAERVKLDVTDVTLTGLSAKPGSDLGVLNVDVRFTVAIGASQGAVQTTTIQLGG